jgi:hypothetical protein
MKRFLLWTLLVLVLAAAAVTPTLWALHNRQHADTINVPNPNVVHVNVSPSDSSGPAE